MKYTDNYHFDIYEPTDNANLLDGYNHTVRMIDAALQQMNGLLVTQGNAIKAFNSRITALETACKDVDTRIAALEAKHQ